ncbi:Amidohydrolase family protein [Roseateles sp. YR242]|uniref:amidohydrolase family protein n=1 Tax=Roseateles sp. YR242 TaxID=1855305 RepID=UPI0008B6B6A9|nr:amidohydrolase family protein [Roseateles sp. YR242]SEK87718.1 Amidohydrolase family protein [Roseateles sp. YR242]
MTMHLTPHLPTGLARHDGELAPRRAFMRLRLAAAMVTVTAAVMTTVSPVHAAEIERLVLVQNGEKVGTLTGTVVGKTTQVDYAVNDNGRGPRHQETIVLGAKGRPVSWTIQGKSLMGGDVNERFAWVGGKATWKSQADDGEVTTRELPLYAVNDGSPWSVGVYARALLQSPGLTLSLLPSGRLRLFDLGERVLENGPGSGRGTGTGRGKGSSSGAIKLRLYRLEGIQLAPSYVLLDSQRKLFATSGGFGVTVREGFEAQATAIRKLVGEADEQRASQLQQTLAHRYDAPVRLRNVRVFDPASGTVGALSTVIVMRDRITAVLPAGQDQQPAPDQVVIDGEGGVVVPGLHDMHSHTSLSSGLFYLAAGVTATRDMGNDNDFLQWLLPQVDAGKIAGPRITPNGLMEGRSPYSLRIGRIPDSLAQAQRDVDWYADRGYFQIKIYNSMNPDWVRPIVEMAKRRGMGVTGHVPAFDTPDRVINDGYEEITHLNQLMLGWLIKPDEDTRTPLRLTALARAATLDLNSAPVQKTVQLMVDHHIPLDPTLVVIERLMLSRAGTVPPGDVDVLDHLPVGLQRYRKRTFVPLKSAEEDRSYFQAFDKMLDTLRLLHSRGIQLLPGTDDETGFTVHRELELYTMAGFTPAQALRAATLDAARHLRQDAQLGSIERGKFADFFLVAGDPTQDIKAIKKARLVFKGGAIYAPSEIYEALNIRPFATTPSMTVPAGVKAGGREGGHSFFSHEHDGEQLE